MYQKIGLKMATSYSPNFNLPKRVKNRIKFIIIHYTGMKKESAAIKRLQDPKSKVSSHYLIKNNGEIINLVPDLYEAWHAGVSSWKHFTSLNCVCSINGNKKYTHKFVNYGNKNRSGKIQILTINGNKSDRESPKNDTITAELRLVYLVNIFFSLISKFKKRRS